MSNPQLRILTMTARQLLEQPEHPEDLVPAKDEAPIKTYIIEADTQPRKRLLLTTPRPRCEVGESSAAAARQPGPTMARRVEYSFVDTVETRVRDTERRMMAAMRVSHQADVHRKKREFGVLLTTSRCPEGSWALRVASSGSVRMRMIARRDISCVFRPMEAGARDDPLEGNWQLVPLGMSVEEIKQIVAQGVANAIKAIAIYESINQTKQRENKVVGNASNKRKWEGDQNGSPNQQQNKEHKVFRAHSVGPNNKKEYLGSLPLCNKCKFHHIGLCAARCEKLQVEGSSITPRECRITGPQ
ncbi:hypothetical protein Tco_1367808 [Tanacetum coccineum]